MHLESQNFYPSEAAAEVVNRELLELAHQTGLEDVTLVDIQDVVHSAEEPMSNDQLWNWIRAQTWSVQSNPLA